MQFRKYLASVHFQFGAAPRWVRYSGIMTLTVAIAWCDIVTPPYVFMTGFYLLPIFLANWYGANSLVIAVVGVSIGTAMNTMSQTLPESAPIWQAALAYSSLVTVFVAFSMLIAYLRTLLMQLKEESQTDGLTALRSRRHFMSVTQYEIHRSIRAGDAFTLVIIDLDNFKHVNDTQGHSAGDALLVAVSRCMTSTLRESDLVGRLGGDEFALALPRTNRAEAIEVLERLHANLRSLLQSFSQRVTASIGAVSVLPGTEVSIERLCDEADKVMYSVKRSSKDAVVVKIYLGRPQRIVRQGHIISSDRPAY